MTVFVLMDEWLACTGSSDDAWLTLGLDLLDGWQASSRPGNAASGQEHLAATLRSMRSQRALSAAPDPVGLALWFHHCGRLDPTLLDRLVEVGGPSLGVRVAWLVRGLAATAGAGGSRPEDPGAALLHSAHRSATSPPHLTAVRAAPPDQ